ncbi:MAG: haloacid dehalogenase type II [Rhodospirillales bacterium]|nr:haloacid dehalogenase type II [Rhodospirillales bacterium]
MNKPIQLENIEACVFDAYGTLFDFGAAAERCRDVLGDKVQQLTQIWRTKQLEYTWLRSLRGDYVDFWHVTGQGLDYALAALGIEDNALRTRLMELYFVLDAFPEVPEVLRTLKDSDFKTGILSNGSPSMLIAAVRRGGLESLLGPLISVDDVGIYKPHPSVYQLAVDRMNVPAEKICFLSANAWDAAGAAYFGLRVVWINRFGTPPEQLPGSPEAEIRTLSELPPLLVR